jgi:phage-related protein
MQQYGPDLGMPHTRPMGRGLFEIRIKSSHGIARVFYHTETNKQIVILHQHIKKTQKTPNKELQIAYRRMKEYRDA